ncbi:transcriptional regulator [Caballeronia arationis]|jgi:hypothetical protein|uniref:Uncharacterized protein n=1 Tax=Caballeronia arationis TaxID=1777142 RepID=A0A7Z7I1D2_9BURK|nr:transcriptional regulator [Caballeronia arationis]SOE49942.1 hypothetical protein SAMN05446927_0386 [Caballeronia arationis]
MMNMHRSRKPERSGVVQHPRMTSAGGPSETPATRRRAGQCSASKMCVDHEDYVLTATATPTHSHLYSADLLVERQGHRKHSVRGLDYFYDAAQALLYSIEWGRLWVTNNVKSIPKRHMNTVTAEAGGEQR